MCQYTIFFRTSNGDVEEAAFFLHRSRIVFRHGGGKQVLFQPDNENIPELQAFGGVHRHHRHLVCLLFLIIILICQQRDFRQKVSKRDMLRSFLAAYLAKLGNTFQQLLQVFLLADSFHRAILKQGTDNAALLHYRSGDFLGRELNIPFDKTGNKLPEIA